MHRLLHLWIILSLLHAFWWVAGWVRWNPWTQNTTILGGISLGHSYSVYLLSRIAEGLKAKAIELKIEGPYTSWWHMFGGNTFGLLLFGPAVATYRFFDTLNKIERKLNESVQVVPFSRQSHTDPRWSPRLLCSLGQTDADGISFVREVSVYPSDSYPQKNFRFSSLLSVFYYFCSVLWIL